MSVADEIDLPSMASFIARALYGSTLQPGDGEPTYGELDEETQGHFLLAAHAAMGAHDAWLAMHGFAIVQKPPMPGALVTPPKPRLVGFG